MTLYEMIYGLDISLNINNQIININNWQPCKDGIIIDLNTISKIRNCNYSVVIKLFLDYTDNVENKEILKKYFS